MIKYILVFIISFLVVLLISPLVFKFTKKLKANQTILKHVKEHMGKQGTPTMGGLMFIFATILVSLCFFVADYMFAIVALGVFFAYGVLGFLDDYIKVRYKQNLGLRAYQKILGQLGVSFIIAIFVYKTIGGELIIPFTNNVINIGAWIIPLIILVYIATVNSVNLVDGLDGLCSTSSICYLIGFVVILLLSSKGFSGVNLAETQNIILICISLIGSLIGFLCFNSFPAKIFMGDTGSLAIGGFIASVSVLTKNILLIPILGLIFVITAFSDIIQVLYYKKTKKRIFKMAPIHHHFQMCGIHENKVVFLYFVFALILNLIVVALYI